MMTYSSPNIKQDLAKFFNQLFKQFPAKLQFDILNPSISPFTAKVAFPPVCKEFLDWPQVEFHGQACTKKFAEKAAAQAATDFLIKQGYADGKLHPAPELQHKVATCIQQWQANRTKLLIPPEGGAATAAPPVSGSERGLSPSSFLCHSAATNIVVQQTPGLPANTAAPCAETCSMRPAAAAVDVANTSTVSTAAATLPHGPHSSPFAASPLPSAPLDPALPHVSHTRIISYCSSGSAPVAVVLPPGPPTSGASKVKLFELYQCITKVPLSQSPHCTLTLTPLPSSPLGHRCVLEVDALSFQLCTPPLHPELECQIPTLRVEALSGSKKESTHAAAAAAWEQLRDWGVVGLVEGLRKDQKKRLKFHWLPRGVTQELMLKPVTPSTHPLPAPWLNPPAASTMPSATGPQQVPHPATTSATTTIHPRLENSVPTPSITHSRSHPFAAAAEPLPAILLAPLTASGPSSSLPPLTAPPEHPLQKPSGSLALLCSPPPVCPPACPRTCPPDSLGSSKKRHHTDHSVGSAAALRGMGEADTPCTAAVGCGDQEAPEGEQQGAAQGPISKRPKVDTIHGVPHHQWHGAAAGAQATAAGRTAAVGPLAFGGGATINSIRVTLSRQQPGERSGRASNHLPLCATTSDVTTPAAQVCTSMDVGVAAGSAVAAEVCTSMDVGVAAGSAVAAAFLDGTVPPMTPPVCQGPMSTLSQLFSIALWGSGVLAPDTCVEYQLLRPLPQLKAFMYQLRTPAVLLPADGLMIPSLEVTAVGGPKKKDAQQSAAALACHYFRSQGLLPPPLDCMAAVITAAHCHLHPLQQQEAGRHGGTANAINSCSPSSGEPAAADGGVEMAGLPRCKWRRVTEALQCSDRERCGVCLKFGWRKWQQLAAPCEPPHLQQLFQLDPAAIQRRSTSHHTSQSELHIHTLQAAATKGTTPQVTVVVVQAASEVASALQQLHSRMKDPLLCLSIETHTPDPQAIPFSASGFPTHILSNPTELLCISSSDMALLIRVSKMGGQAPPCVASFLANPAHVLLLPCATSSTTTSGPPTTSRECLIRWRIEHAAGLDLGGAVQAVDAPLLLKGLGYDGGSLREAAARVMQMQGCRRPPWMGVGGPRLWRELGNRVVKFAALETILMGEAVRNLWHQHVRPSMGSSECSPGRPSGTSGETGELNMHTSGCSGCQLPLYAFLRHPHLFVCCRPGCTETPFFDYGQYKQHVEEECGVSALVVQRGCKRCGRTLYVSGRQSE